MKHYRKAKIEFDDLKVGDIIYNIDGTIPKKVVDKKRNRVHLFTKHNGRLFYMGKNNVEKLHCIRIEVTK